MSSDTVLRRYDLIRCTASGSDYGKIRSTSHTERAKLKRRDAVLIVIKPIGLAEELLTRSRAALNAS